MKPVLLNIKKERYNVLTKLKVTNNFIVNLFSNLPFNNFSKRGANDPAVWNPWSQALLEEESTPLLGLLLVCVLILTDEGDHITKSSKVLGLPLGLV